MSTKEYPVVLRFEGMNPSDLGGFEAHRLRKGGDLGHVDQDRSCRNDRFIGDADWAQQARMEIEEMRKEMFAAELEYHERRKDRKAIQKRLVEGPRDPWRASRHGPLRELILTANKEWFEHIDDPNVNFNTQREVDFKRLAKAWLKESFGDDVIHARADRDEQAFHIHAVILPRSTVRKYGVDCRVLQPSEHSLIRDYEKAQDSVGEYFSKIGLVRGERRKQAVRDALNNGKAPPQQPRHVRPAKWREKEELRLAKRAEEIETRRREVADRQRDAADIIDFADAVATGRMDEAGRAVRSETPSEKAAPPIPPGRKASTGFTRARMAFRAAVERLRRREKQYAEKAAAAKIAAQIAEIKQADDVIVRIAQKLPMGLRNRIAKARLSLTAKIMTLDPAVHGRQTPRLDGRSSGEGRDE